MLAFMIAFGSLRRRMSAGWRTRPGLLVDPAEQLLQFLLKSRQHFLRLFVAVLDARQLVDEQLVDLGIVVDQMVVRFEAVFVCALVYLLDLRRIDAVEVGVVRLRRLLVDGRIAAGQVDGLLLHLGGYEIFDPFQRFLRMLGILEHEQRIDIEDAAHLRIRALRNGRHADLEVEVARCGQAPRADDGHADLAGEERVAELARDGFAECRRRRYMLIPDQAVYLFVGVDDLRLVEIDLGRLAAIGPGVVRVDIGAEVLRALVPLPEAEVEPVLGLRQVFGVDRHRLGVLHHFIKRPALVLIIRRRVREAGLVEHILVVQQDGNIAVQRDAVRLAADLVDLHHVVRNIVVRSLEVPEIRREIHQHALVVIFHEAAVAPLGGDVRRILRRDGGLQLGIELLVRRLGHLDLDAGMLGFKVGNELLHEGPVRGIDRVMRNGDRIPCRAAAAGAAGQDRCQERGCCRRFGELSCRLGRSLGELSCWLGFPFGELFCTFGELSWFGFVHGYRPPWMVVDG
ncbi:hypothetical protein BN871_AN_00270 [Paenibacillus sp. P22]|nr:hypothetical protein BN871_AN_00270 [Paenibacillus sp. P22]